MSSIRSWLLYGVRRNTTSQKVYHLGFHQSVPREAFSPQEPLGSPNIFGIESIHTTRDTVENIANVLLVSNTVSNQNMETRDGPFLTELGQSIITQNYINEMKLDRHFERESFISSIWYQFFFFRTSFFMPDWFSIYMQIVK